MAIYHPSYHHHHPRLRSNDREVYLFTNEARNMGRQPRNVLRQQSFAATE